MRWIPFLAVLVLVPAIAGASALGDASHALPSAEDFLRVLSLRDPQSPWNPAMIIFWISEVPE